MRTLGEALERVARMEWTEIRTRLGQEISKRLDLWSFKLGRTMGHSSSVQPLAVEPAFFFSPDEIPGIAAVLRKHMPDQCAAIVAAADSICNHEFDLLGFEKITFGSRLDWHLDTVHGKRFRRRIWYKVPYLGADAGDSKIVWELNRHQHLVTLAKAYRLTGESRFAQEVFDEWDDWQRGNPYPVGINWVSSLEVAFRGISWLWTYHLLNGTDVLTESFRERLWRSLYLHGRHIERYLSTYSSPNTHLIGEAVGLFFLGMLCPELRGAAEWKQKGWSIVLEEARRQVLADGMHFEQSTYYHVYAVDFFLHARILASRNAVDVPPEFDDTIKRMLEWLSSIGQSGTVPRFGDDDGGRVFDGRRNRGEHLLDPLSTGAVLFGRADWKAVAGGIREETVWLLGPNSAEDYEKLPYEPVPARSLFQPNSGTYIMAEEGETRQQLTIDAGDQGVFDSGHGHADALSVQFSMNKREWLADPGTFSYLPGGEAREAFRGTSGHNTLQVDEQSQAIPRSPFTWKGLPKIEVKSWINTEDFQFFEGCHTGYRRFPQPVVHRRLVFHSAPGLWFFLDLAEGHGTHRLDLSWHFGLDITLEHQEANAWIFSNGSSAQLALLTAGAVDKSSVEQGWYSPAYGKRVPAWVLRHSKTATLPDAFATLMIPSVAKTAELGNFRELPGHQPSPGVYGYCYTTKHAIHQFWFASEKTPWRMGSLASDAQFLYCNFMADGQMDRFILCDGTFLRLDDRLLFEARERTLSYEWRYESARHPAVR
jgi:hypothetical protein